MQGRMDLAALGSGLESVNLVAAMLQRDSNKRPPMAAVLAHPAWWPAARKLAFLVDLSNAMEFQDRQVCHYPPCCVKLLAYTRTYGQPRLLANQGLWPIKTYGQLRPMPSQDP